MMFITVDLSSRWECRVGCKITRDVLATKAVLHLVRSRILPSGRAPISCSFSKSPHLEFLINMHSAESVHGWVTVMVSRKSPRFLHFLL